MRVDAISIGACADQVLRQGRTARVIADFDRSFYLQAGDRVFCVADHDLHDGPLNLLVSRPPNSQSWLDLGVHAGQAWLIDPHVIRAAEEPHMSIDLGAVSRWAPAPWPTNAPRYHQIIDAVRHLKYRLADDRESDGFLPLVLTPLCEPRSAVHRAAVGPLRELRQKAADWLISGDENILQSAADLLGLGQGLTPSGDDVVAGFLLAAHAVGQGERAADLWHGLKGVARKRTHAISFAHLSAAADGLGAAPLHALLGAFLENQDDQLEEALDAVAAIGHSSGLDAVSGVLILLEAWLRAGKGASAAA